MKSALVLSLSLISIIPFSLASSYTDSIYARYDLHAREDLYAREEDLYARNDLYARYAHPEPRQYDPPQRRSAYLASLHRRDPYKPAEIARDDAIRLYKGQEQTFGNDHSKYTAATFQTLLSMSRKIVPLAQTVVQLRVQEKGQRITAGLPVDPGHDQAIKSALSQVEWANDRIRHLTNELSLLNRASGR